MDAIVVQLEVGPMANFAYIFGCPVTREVVLIDPTADTERLLREVASLGATLVGAINTHGHVDHVAGNAAIKQATGVPFYAHRAAAIGERDALNAMYLQLLGGSQPPRPDHLFDDGDEIEVGQQRLKVIHAPGHTPGDVLLYSPGALFTGDVLFVGGIGRTDLPGGSLEQLFRSLRERVAPLPAETVVYPGHDYGPRPTSTVGDEMRHNPFFQEALAEAG